jgi:hypothetical protein
MTQVSEIERMSRLRRFLPPQVADLIVASGTEKQLENRLEPIHRTGAEHYDTLRQPTNA